MRRLSTLFPLLLLMAAGCTPGMRGVPAPADALDCAAHVLAGHGYHVTHTPENFPTALRAERQLPPESFYSVMGVVDVTLFGDGSGERRMRVSGQRYEVVATGGGSVSPTLDPLRPTAGVNDPRPAGQARTRRRVLSPGPVAGHVTAVRSRCGLREPPHAESLAAASVPGTAAPQPGGIGSR
jgi:hypothetical protein